MGRFDGLPGKGSRSWTSTDPTTLWWIRQKVARENLAHLPPTLQIRKDRDDALERVAKATTEAQVRADRRRHQQAHRRRQLQGDAGPAGPWTSMTSSTAGAPPGRSRQPFGAAAVWDAVTVPMCQNSPPERVTEMRAKVRGDVRAADGDGDVPVH